MGAGGADPRPAQSWDAARYARDCGFVADHGRAVLDWLDVQAGERILDLGCGDGTLTAELAARGAQVLGVDADASMVEATRARGLEARQASGEALPLELSYNGGFDAVFSNAALHWMPDADLVAAGVYRTLRPGGRFVAEMGGQGNVEAVRHALIDGLDRRGLDGAAADPWFFPSIGDYASRLEQAGFRVEACLLFPRPTPVAAGLRAWLETFAGSFLALLPEDERGPYLDEVAADLAPTCTAPDGSVTLDYVRLRFRAVKP
ncbi:class I SAM-dependent methyltransferase [Oleisolibacter albus]|uniref:class I SAM-dependent methyltransferase n=1 Tax=Oleisolibacter albus TaxID=2171757 RepID=UPI000DF22C84|nr:class I SAM-dependent methyltransferase [Oleisolibacter albus]